MTGNSNLRNAGFAPAREDKHWKFACNNGARGRGDKHSFAVHHGLEAETGGKGCGAFSTKVEVSRKLIGQPRRLAARAGKRGGGISPTAMRWGSVEHFALQEWKTP
jgi:hypothetical protein